MIKIPKEELEKIKQSLQAEINRLNSQNGELKGKLDNTKKETKKLLGEARIEINGLKDKIESLNHETEIERKTHKLETKNLQILIGEGKEELETKKTRIKDLREQLEKSTTNHKELQSNHNSLEEAGQKFLDAYRLKEQELAELAWQIKQERTITYTFYQTQGNKFIKLKAESEEDRANFLANLRSKQGKFANLTQEISDLGDTSDDLLISKNSKITALHDKVQAKEEIITELTTKSNRKQKQIILLDQQLVADQTKIKDLTQLLTQKEKEVEQLTNRLTNTQQKLVRTEQYQQNRIANLINQQTSLTNELTELEEVGKKLLSTYFQKEEELVGKENQISNFMNMTRNFSQKMMEVLNEKLQEIKRWEDYYEQTSNLLTKKNYKISTLINELDTIKNERDTYLTELNQLDQDFREQERLLIHKNTKLSQEITKTNNLESENQTLKGQLTYYFDQDNKLRQTIQDLQNQLNSHTHTHTQEQIHTCSPCPLIHLPEPHICPMEVNCSHSDYQQIKDQRDNYQQQLTNQEQEIIQRLNTTFNLGLDQNEKDLQKAILEIQELINKPPLTITDETIKQELEKAQQTIIQLQNQLNRKPNTPLGETIKEIIQIDEKLLHENENLKIELNQQTSDYQALAEERNKLVLAQIKEINVQKLCQIIPQAQKAEIQQAFLKANNYEELAQARNKLIVQHINQNSQSQNLSTLTLPLIQPKEERIILISLLVVSLLTIGGLLVKLKNPNKSRSK